MKIRLETADKAICQTRDDAEAWLRSGGWKKEEEHWYNTSAPGWFRDIKMRGGFYIVVETVPVYVLK